MVAPFPDPVDGDLAEAIGRRNSPGDVGHGQRAVATIDGQITLIADDIHGAEGILDSLHAAPVAKLEPPIRVADIAIALQSRHGDGSEAIAETEIGAFGHHDVVAH